VKSTLRRPSHRERDRTLSASGGLIDQSLPIVVFDGVEVAKNLDALPTHPSKRSSPAWKPQAASVVAMGLEQPCSFGNGPFLEDFLSVFKSLGSLGLTSFGPGSLKTPCSVKSLVEVWGGNLKHLVGLLWSAFLSDAFVFCHAKSVAPSPSASSGV
jgi:hypothetical protein